MALGFGTYALGLLAGLLSTLSPCVLPILPIILGTAAAEHPRAPLVLALGLALSYAILGTLIAWSGSVLELESSIFKNIGALLLAAMGMVLISSRLQQKLQSLTAGLGHSDQGLFPRFNPSGLTGQFLVGIMLGIVWSPCVGPTLGAAILLASQGSHLPEVSLLMGLFGIGAALPVVGMAYASRAALIKSRARLLQTAEVGKKIMGWLVLLVALALLAGIDKSLEAWLVDISPNWLTALTTRF
jgi:cytochrome c biogenesis protein CcdA